jgi:hypothetical protein
LSERSDNPAGHRNVISAARGLWQAHAAMDPPLPGFTRVVVGCRACGWEDVLDLQSGVCSPTRLRRVWRCSACTSRAIEVDVVLIAVEGGNPPALGESEGVS